MADGDNGGLNLNPNMTADSQVAGGDGNAIYCAWGEYNAAGVRQLRMSRYDGSNDAAPNWVPLDSDDPAQGLNYNPAANTTSPGVQSFNGKIYLHWNEGTRRVRVWDPTRPTGEQWVWADGGGLRSNTHFYPNTDTLLASFGVYRNHLLLFNHESATSSLQPRISLARVLVGLEPP